MDAYGHIPVWTGERIERTNARGRHRYCAPFKAWMVEQALSPGMSTAGLAMRNQVNANQLRRWVLLHRVRESTASSADPGPQRLLPVNVVPDRPAPSVSTPVTPGGMIEIELCGAVVRVQDGTQAQTLRTVLDALRAPPR